MANGERKQLSEDEARALIARITAEFADKGKIIEGGWHAFELLQLQGASAEQICEMRKAYFLGAQHLFASIMNFLDDGTEPTPQDLNRMMLINKELMAFVHSLSH